MGRRGRKLSRLLRPCGCRFEELLRLKNRNPLSIHFLLLAFFLTNVQSSVLYLSR